MSTYTVQHPPTGAELVADLLAPSSRPRRRRAATTRAHGPSRLVVPKRRLRIDKLEGRHVSNAHVGGALTIALCELDGTVIDNYQISEAPQSIWRDGRQFWLWGVDKPTSEIVYVPAPPEKN